MNSPYKLMRCCKCGFTWESPKSNTTCVACGHLYVEWLNHRLWTDI